MADEMEKGEYRITGIESGYAHSSVAEMMEDRLFQLVLSVVQDGICLLSADYDVLYANPAMRFWYEINECSAGRKCYEIFHKRDSICEGCPAVLSVSSGRAESADHFFRSEKAGNGYRRVFCVPVSDDEGNVVMFIEYVRDITSEKKTSLSLELLEKQLQAMTEILEKREEEQKKKEQLIVGSVNRSFDRVLGYLSKVLDEDSYKGVKISFDITRKSIGKERSSSVVFTQQELTIARYIAEGALSKEIADKLMITKKAVDYHRTNIRKKLKLKPDDNLRQALVEFFMESGL
ncbi:MAG: PAS domain-containing protein [Mogibacterium sp.]|nr:PAS domain-containing protein [Mogibacterium sp.]